MPQSPLLAKVVIASLKPKAKRRTAAKVRNLDPYSPTLGEDFLELFRRNVTTARENTRGTGRPDAAMYKITPNVGQSGEGQTSLPNNQKPISGNGYFPIARHSPDAARANPARARADQLRVGDDLKPEAAIRSRHAHQ